MSDSHDNFDAEALREGLLELADIIRRLDEEGELLAAAPELIKIFGDLRSQLFEYEVRHTGMFERRDDLPEVLEAQRIVDEAARQLEEEDREWWRRFSSESDN
jgi:hypothetical protein